MNRHSKFNLFFVIILLALTALACNTLSGDTGGAADTGTAVPAAENGTAEPSMSYDNIPEKNNMSNAMAEFTAISKWSKNDLAYVFLNGTETLPGDTEKDLVRQAFQLWADVAPLTFTEVSSASQADFLISWEVRDHGDGDPFDGIGGILGHATFPNPYADRQVIIHFDDEEPWVDSTTIDVDLVTVAAHEIGHALGLDHSNDINSLMYASYFGPRRFLSQDDINGIQSLYGQNETTQEPPQAPPANPQTPTSAPGEPDTDGDGLSDVEEAFIVGTDYLNPDTDGDGLTDGVEVENRMNPLDPDMDKDGISDGDEVANGTDPFFPDNEATSDPGMSPELADEVSKFLTRAIDTEIEAFAKGDPSIAAEIFAGSVLADVQTAINDLNSQGLVEISELDYYESYINDIRVINNDRLDVDTCETWTTATYRLSDGAFLGSEGPDLLPQTITIERLSDGWYITDVVFFDAPAFCNS
ncbi:MAG: matrixin family metalloprotease [Candidatus Promineifilaceae bacterium]